ncbi:MAG: HlyD family secretion protein [Sedimenticola thiotaurini]|uniref:HlyD family secretion protein n=1 Tax=Sedimenticola thiotaurini TaxID=1543721 RepID=A0A558DFS5_9GAMM|nr:MAG: HlyD family secretion protein [Sedimenticola thiotaurini]
MNTAPNTQVPTSDQTVSSQNRAVKRLFLLIVLPTITAVIGSVIYLKAGRFVETDNAYVKADKVQISTEVSGIIDSVTVAENQRVTKGQLLFQLDSAPFQVSVAKVEAKLAQVRTDIAALKATYREKRAEIALAQTRYDFSLKEQQRQRDLLAKNFISTSKYDDAKQNADLAALQVVAVQQDLKRITATLGGSIDAPIEQHPNYLAAQAELEQAKLDLARTAVHAPQTGVVSMPPKTGQYITAGKTAMALVVNGNLWIEANFTETDLTYVHPGQTVTVHIDTYPDHAWKGVVDSLSPATSAEFALIPAQNATGNWVKIAQRVPVRIKLDQTPDDPELRAGLSAVTEIDTGHKRSLFGITL